MVEWFDRVAPKPLLQAIDAYSDLGNIHNQGAWRVERKILTKLGAQIALNLLIVTGIFIGAVFLQRQMVVWWPEFPGGVDGTKAATWLVALLVSFPLLVAVWRLEAGAMVVAESAAGPRRVLGISPFNPSSPGRSSWLVRLVLLVTLLSSTLLPSGTFSWSRC